MGYTRGDVVFLKRNNDELVRTIFSRKDAKDAKKISFNVNPPEADRFPASCGV